MNSKFHVILQRVLIYLEAVLLEATLHGASYTLQNFVWSNLPELYIARLWSKTAKNSD